jgi:UDP-N-acetylmuramoyl-tripeptide--D-alanyl-D-alanine ligase
MKEFAKKIIVALLTWEAKRVLTKKKPYVIAVTGNLGKTSTKDAVYAVLKDHFYVRRSEKSFNSDFGVPLTILGEKSAWNHPLKWLGILYRGFFVAQDSDYPTHLVLEIGADKPGDIKSIAKWLTPDIAVMTQFAEVPVHVEFFKDREHLIKEKEYLPKSLREEGLFIYNADDHDSVLMKERISARNLSYGIEHVSDAYARHISVYGEPDGTLANATICGEEVKITLPQVLGKSPVYATLPALLIAHELQVPLSHAVTALRDGEKPKGRMRLLPGMNKSTIIDDTYNSSPKAVHHGLKTMQTVDAKGRKIVVLGDMLELGDHTREEHYKVGKEVAKTAHMLITVGVRSRFIAEGALDAGMKDEDILECESSLDAGKELVSRVKEGDVVYVKGSQSMRMEKAVKMILASEHDPHKLLVRQDTEWLLK